MGANLVLRNRKILNMAGQLYREGVEVMFLGQDTKLRLIFSL